MEKSIFKYILRYSLPQQIVLLLIIVAFYPFLYVSLDLPKIIVNRAIKADAAADGPFSVPLFGYEVPLDVDQVVFLLILSFSYLALVFITGAFKYYINVYKGRIGERLLRRLRYQLYGRILRFPLPHFKKVSQAEMIPMITQEVEPLGGFIGIAYADPMFFGGQLLIILGYILIQDPYLGLAAIALYPVQMYAIPKLQRRVNALAKERVQNVRRLADHLGESVSGIAEIHANDTAQLELARFSDRLNTIYRIRFDIYRRKFFIKFLNNFIDKLTPFFFFAIGGYLVIHGDLTVGALVAVLNAYKDLASPWKEMLVWYQQKEDVRIKYEQVVEQFEPQGMLDESLQTEEPERDIRIGTIEASNLSLIEDEGLRAFEGVSATFPAGRHIAIVGDGNSGKNEFGMVLARLVAPTGGRVLADGQDVARLPQAVTGRRMAYVGPSTALQAFSIRDNLLYGLKHRPARAAARGRRAEDEAEAALTGNSPFDYHADWVDRSTFGVEDEKDMTARLVDVLRQVDLDEDVYHLGLRGTVDPAEHPDVAARIMAARAALRDRLSDPALARLVEPFDPRRYNTNATVAENILFGLPVGTEFDLDQPADHPFVRKILEEVGLRDDFLQIGRKVAETMVELFADLPPGHAFFDQFSFIKSDDLPEYQAILGRGARGPEGLNDADRRQLLSLPFKLIVARHRLDLIDEAMQERILDARRAFAKTLPDALRDKVAFFDADTYTATASLQDNILFGKVAYGQAQAASKIGALIGDVVGALDLRDVVISVGLEFGAGPGGSRLSQAQRQKLAIARALLKAPDVMILNEATSSLDPATQIRIIDSVIQARDGRSLIWILNRAGDAWQFDDVVVMKAGQVVETGAFDSLREAGGAFQQLLEQS